MLDVRNLRKYFPIHSGFLRRVRGHLKAVDDVSFVVSPGEIFGLVGESGSGKSTLGKVVLRLMEPSGGEIYFQGAKIHDLPSEKLRPFRKDMQIIFQDPQASLNPRMTVSNIIARPMKIFGLLNSGNPRERVAHLLEKVGLKEDYLDSYPHEMSGGQQQRVGIARALSLHPRLLVLDEPTASLDVSIQSQIINLLLQLQNDLALSYLFISHNLSLVRFMSHRIAVMYLGKIVELAAKDELWHRMAHPYTQILFSSIPRLAPPDQAEKTGREKVSLNMERPERGCRFRPRCRYRENKCESEPEWREIAPSHFVACHLFP